MPSGLVVGRGVVLGGRSVVAVLQRLLVLERQSGATGDVNRRFGLRFGSAALLSIVGAGPTLAAAQSDTEVGAEVAEDIADDFSLTTQSVASEYARIPQEISIQPGASITVIVDRDLEFF